MVNFTRLACVMGVATIASSQSLSSIRPGTSINAASSGSGIAKSSNLAVTSGVTAPTGGQTGTPSAPPDSLLPPLSLLNSKLKVRQTPPFQIETSVGPPLSGPIPSGTAVPLPPGDPPSATRRVTGIVRRQRSFASVSTSGSTPPKPSPALQSGPPASSVPSLAPDVTEQKFSKLPPNFDSAARIAPRATETGKQLV